MITDEYPRWEDRIKSKVVKSIASYFDPEGWFIYLFSLFSHLQSSPCRYLLDVTVFIQKWKEFICGIILWHPLEIKHLRIMFPIPNLQLFKIFGLHSKTNFNMFHNRLRLKVKRVFILVTSQLYFIFLSATPCFYMCWRAFKALCDKTILDSREQSLRATYWHRARFIYYWLGVLNLSYSS